MKDLFYHEFRSNRALVRQIKAEVDGCFANLLLHVCCLFEYSDHNRLDFAADGWRLNISEESWQCTLHQLQQSKEILQHWVLQTLQNQFNESLEIQLDRQILTVDLCRHGIPSAWVQIDDLLLDLLYCCLSRRPASRNEAGDDLSAKEVYQVGILCQLLGGQRFRMGQNDGRRSKTSSNLGCWSWTSCNRWQHRCCSSSSLTSFAPS